MEFKRGKQKNTDVAKRMIYESRCGLWKMEKHDCLFQKRTVWYALYYADHYGQKYWSMLVHMKTYRTRNAAEQAMEKYRRILDGKPMKRKAAKRKR